MVRSAAGHAPEIDPAAFVHEAAEVIGWVRLGAHSSVWPGAVVRGDVERIAIGEGSNIQDGAVLHSDPGQPLLVGDGVTVGHQACLHGCKVADEVLVGIGARVLNGARVGAGAIVGAGALVPEGADVPAGALVFGLPAKVVRDVTAAERARGRAGAERYVEMISAHGGPAQ